MRIFLLLLFTLTAPKLKLQYVEKGVPLYLHINATVPDAQDAMSLFLKDTLSRSGLKLITKEKKDRLYKAYLDDVDLNMKDVVFSDKNAAALEYKRKGFAQGTPSQEITIQYTSETVNEPNLTTCDSAGFLLEKIPEIFTTGTRRRMMFHIKEIGSRSPQAVAVFLLSKM